MRYLAIDYGEKRTGLAICDPAQTIASPLTVIEGQRQLLQQIAFICKAEAVRAIVIGLPLNMDGSEGPQAKTVRKFAARLRTQIDIPLCFQDERLSSFAAQDKLAPARLSRAKTKKYADAVAAAEILNNFLDAKKGR
ncbi:MAG: Holliday junction resolvase RuvX [Phycisphaerales bacterium]|nr:MAG: Holliday junction resolvase RuvX [Phycisphaerales bacterium]